LNKLGKIYITSLITYIVAAFFLSLDQVTKQLIAQTFNIYQSNVVFPWLNLTYVVNIGAGFSILRGKVLLLCLFAGTVSIGLIIFEMKTRHHRTKLLSFSLGFILGGALGNLIDRIRMGHVIDFLDLRYNGQNIWPIFNVADISINIGIGLLILYYIFQESKHDKEEEEKGKKEVEKIQDEKSTEIILEKNVETSSDNNENNTLA